LQITTLRAKALPSLAPSNYEPHFSKIARYAVSFINFAVGRLRKETFYGKLFLLKGAIVGAFAKLRKTTISFVMSVCPHTTRLPLDGFSLNLTFWNFSKIC